MFYQLIYKWQALIGALLLDSDGKNKIIDRIFESKNHNFIQIAIAFAAKNKKVIDANKIIPFLYCEDDNTRITAISYLALRMNDKDKQKLLKSYTERENYYYNVVCWLDRILYSPTRLRNYYKNSLSKKLFLKIDSVEGDEYKNYGRFLSAMRYN